MEQSKIIDMLEMYHDTYAKRLKPDKLEPKSEKCIFIGYPKETIGYTFYHISDADGNVTVYKARLVAKGFRQVSRG